MTETAPDPTPTHPVAPADAKAYRVLARKYRPSDFSEVIGQEALVRTLSNAIRSGRLAHAFMLTGVRGVGKTTTARIIARALNCIGADGTGGPTVTPCGTCEPCRAIAADRHVDVLEMDAASRTGVNDIRELIDSVRYGPVSARYKVYIIDEVHMLSNNAFNALLKTLEEPPAHVKFVFATTEIRKVPVTVLSRCQRFDLRRVDGPTLVAHFTKIARNEGIAVEPDAVALIARAADGSVRDGMSLLDQAIALAGDRVTAVQVRDMLGLADRAIVVDLFEAALTGQPARALDILADLHRAGADPLVVLQDLLDFTHFLTRCRVVPETADDPGTPEAERLRGKDLSARLGMPALTRTWQILLKGIGEVQAAPVPFDAAEMVVIRLAYGADLPDPAGLVRQLQHVLQGGVAAAASAPVAAPRPTAPVASAPVASAAMAPTASALRPAVQEAPRPEVTALAEAAPAPEAMAPADPKDFRELVQLFADRREAGLYGQLYGSVHLVRMEPGLLEVRLKDRTQGGFAGKVGSLLTEWTGRRWMVSVSGAPGRPTLLEQDRSAEQAALEEAGSHPVVRMVLETFPGARIERIRGFGETPPAPADEGVAGGGLAGTAAEDDVMDMPVDPADLLDEEGEF